jgi:hypothetical protein
MGALLGLSLFRSHFVIRSRFGFLGSSLIMILLFIDPCSTQSAYNRIYDAALVTEAYLCWCRLAPAQPLPD